MTSENRPSLELYPNLRLHPHWAELIDNAPVQEIQTGHRFEIKNGQEISIDNIAVTQTDIK